MPALDQIATAQAQKEVTANANFDAVGAAALFGRRASTTVGLTFGYYGGPRDNAAGVPTQIAAGTVALTASATNYITETDGVLTVATAMPTGWPGPLAGGAKALWEHVTSATGITSSVDWRRYSGTAGPTGAGFPAGGAAKQVLRKLTATDYDTEWSTLTAQSLADFAQDPATTTGLTYGYAAGTIRSDNVVTAVAAGTVLLTASTTNYVEVTGAGAVSANTTGFTAGRFPMVQVVTDATAITGVTDKRGLVYVQPAQPFDLSAFYPGVPAASAIVLRVPVARAAAFPAALAGSYGTATVAATAQADFDIQKNGVSVGTMRFAAASATATFIAASAISLVAGDVLSIIAPATADATLANVGAVLAGTR